MELKSRHPHGFHLLAQRVSGYLFMVAGQREARGSNRTIDSARSAKEGEQLTSVRKRTTGDPRDAHAFRKRCTAVSVRQELQHTIPNSTFLNDNNAQSSLLKYYLVTREGVKEHASMELISRKPSWVTSFGTKG